MTIWISGKNIFEDNGAPVWAESRFGLVTNGAYGDDVRKVYLGLKWTFE